MWSNLNPGIVTLECAYAFRGKKKRSENTWENRFNVFRESADPWQTIAEGRSQLQLSTHKSKLIWPYGQPLFQELFRRFPGKLRPFLFYWISLHGHKTYFSWLQPIISIQDYNWTNLNHKYTPWPLDMALALFTNQGLGYITYCLGRQKRKGFSLFFLFYIPSLRAPSWEQKP